ncbi:hypothetical protein [Rhizobium sp. L51/94]|uniref:hypothetical protein n=1 Tax=Rhizobium sp. L51/94 TaxID=2819999 RepID=UPI001C5B3484|nr:hypothetical protein [Rhizobium sp. L51/94]QXZ80943.1 hypothetical protein J5274_18660 [Rhizobium sp. L51/94]
MTLVIAEHLAFGKPRFLTDVQIGVLRRKYGATRDEVRTAAIMADRIRRHRQAEEQRNSFRIKLVPMDALVTLKTENRKTIKVGSNEY